jgi:putative acetyltransferase
MRNDLIRKYEPADLEELLTAWETANAVAHPFLSADFQASERDNIINLYLPNTETWVWEADGRVVGFIALLGNEVGGLFINSAFQRQGIGAALVDHACTLREELEVDVFKKNVIGRAFYEKYGFVPISESVHEASGFETMRLKLAAA